MIMSTCNFLCFVFACQMKISMYMWYVNTLIAKAKLTKIYVTGHHSYFTYLLLIF